MNDRSLALSCIGSDIPPDSTLLFHPTSMEHPPFLDVEKVDTHLSFQPEIDSIYLNIYILEFEVEGRRIVAKNVVEFQQERDETGSYLLARDERFGIYLAAETREELEIAVREEFKFLWRQYAMENDDALSDDAIYLKAELLNTFEEHK